MKVFVYKKADNKMIAIFEHVGNVSINRDGNTIEILDETGTIHTYDCKVVKTRIYQN